MQSDKKQAKPSPAKPSKMARTKRGMLWAKAVEYGAISAFPVEETCTHIYFPPTYIADKMKEANEKGLAEPGLGSGWNGRRPRMHEHAWDRRRKRHSSGRRSTRLGYRSGRRSGGLGYSSGRGGKGLSSSGAGFVACRAMILVDAVCT